MQTNTYQAIKIKNTILNKIDDFLVVEAPLQININKKPYTVVMRTPKSDKELVRGLLYAEDILKKKSSFYFKIIEEKNNVPTIINVTIAANNLGKGYLNKRTLLSVSSCGICGKTALTDIKVSGKKLAPEKIVDAVHIYKMFIQLKKYQETFLKTGGSHAAGLFSATYTLLSIKEDIGRHNAVDKVIGDLLLTEQLNQAKYLLVSGRVSYEIVTKAFIAKIPVIIAVSACSSLAVDFAKEFGICLIGFTRAQKMTIYSNPEYLK